MKSAKLPVKVEDGTFSSERNVSFSVGDKHYSMVVDPEDLEDDNLRVNIVAESASEAIVDLPRETMTSGSRLRVPKDLVTTDAKK